MNSNPSKPPAAVVEAMHKIKVELQEQFSPLGADLVILITAGLDGRWGQISIGGIPEIGPNVPSLLRHFADEYEKRMASATDGPPTET